MYKKDMKEEKEKLKKLTSGPTKKYKGWCNKIRK